MPRIENLAQDDLQARWSTYDEMAKLGGLDNASSSTGAFVIPGDNGQPTVRIGNLLSIPGERGVEVEANGQWVPVASLAISEEHSTIPGEMSMDAKAASQPVWDDKDGPSVTVHTFTGRISVTVGGRLAVSGYKGTGIFSYTIRSASGQVMIGAAEDRGLATSDLAGSATAGSMIQASNTVSHQLAPGRYTVSARYGLLASVTVDTTMKLTNRTLIAKGF